MLATLRKFDRATRSGILATYAESLLPTPWAEESGIEDSISVELRENLNNEIKRTLNLRSVDSPEAKQKVLQFLSKEISAAVIETKNVKEVRDRVGQAGSLPIGLYDLAFSDTFKENEFKGVTRNSVRGAAQNPDQVEHLLPENFGQDQENASTLITKTYQGKSPYTLLIYAVRQKAKLRIDNAWLVFHSDVDLSSAKTPTDVLKAFLEKFGSDLQIGELRSKFFLYETFPKTPGISFHQSVKAHIEPGRTSYMTLLARDSVSRMEIAYAFALDVTAYEDSLRKHGIKFGR